MARVDAEDDSIRRFVVRHYRYDPARHERRHVVVAAFDNEREFTALLESIRDDIEKRRAAGEPVDRNEHASGTVHEPGDRRRAATGHLIRRAMEHGVDPRPWINMDDVPSNIAFLSLGEEPRSRPARLSVRGFLFARYLAMVAWVVLVMAAYLVYRTISPNIDSDFLRWLLNLATLAASIALGLFIQRRALRWLDPDGELRRQVAHDERESRREA
ncbi:hypothetical protein [Pedococcus soli]